MNKLAALGALILVAFGLVMSAAYIVPEGRQAIITQFGRPVGSPIVKTGLHFKTPFVQEVRYVERRILSWDGFPSQIPTKDKKYIHVDTTARFKIVDALKFIQTVQNERGAKAKLDTILDGHTRDIISSHNLVEAVRNTNSILNDIEKNRVSKKEDSIEEEVTGQVEKIIQGREELSKLIVKRASVDLKPFGIDLIDVQLKRISYEKSVENKVYERMISERQRIAEKIRSIGKGEKAKIEGRMARELRRIESEAYKSAQIIRGGGEAKSIDIYARSLSKDAKFYEFTRTLDAYERSLTKKKKFILSSGSDFFKLLKSGKY